jgi:anti-anti-sigma factor
VDGGAVIDLHGQIDRTAEQAVAAAYDDVTQTEAPLQTLTLNFTDVDYINSTGIAVIVGVLARARKDGVAVSAYGLTDHYKHIFQITRLSDFMTIVDEEQAGTGGVE